MNEREREVRALKRNKREKDKVRERWRKYNEKVRKDRFSA